LAPCVVLSIGGHVIFGRDRPVEQPLDIVNAVSAVLTARRVWRKHAIGYQCGKPPVGYVEKPSRERVTGKFGNKVRHHQMRT
jgi:hypothetical protein